MGLGMVVWDFQLADRNLILEWADDVRLGKRDRALLDQKLDALSALDFELATHTHLVAGPLNNSPDKHIYKLRVNASIMIRVMLCRGPLPGEAACTLLAGATERDMALVPANAPQTASERRKQVLGSPKQYRRTHEKFIIGKESSKSTGTC